MFQNPQNDSFEKAACIVERVLILFWYSDFFNFLKLSITQEEWNYFQNRTFDERTLNFIVIQIGDELRSK